MLMGCRTGIQKLNPRFHVLIIRRIFRICVNFASKRVNFVVKRVNFVIFGFENDFMLC